MQNCKRPRLATAMQETSRITRVIAVTAAAYHCTMRLSANNKSQSAKQSVNKSASATLLVFG
eukprot:15361-Heterococcus_DN1.PRE.3